MYTNQATLDRFGIKIIKFYFTYMTIPSSRKLLVEESFFLKKTNQTNKENKIHKMFERLRQIL